MKEERFLHPGCPHTCGEIGWDRGGFRALEENAAASLWQPKWRENCTDGQCHHPALLSLRHTTTCAGGGWQLELKLQSSELGRGLGLAVWKQPERGWNPMRPQLRVYMEEAWTALEASHHFWGMHEGRDRTWIVAFFPVPVLPTWVSGQS